MTIGTPLEQPIKLRTWTLAQLDLEPETTASDLRGTFVQCLADEDFVPPWRWQQAFALMHRPGQRSAESVLGHGQLLLDEEERLRGEVSEFASAFFDMDCTERRHRWQLLREQCVLHPALGAWLRDLERGLDTVPVLVEGWEGPFEDRVQELARHVCALFVLRPGPRARRRQELLLEMQSDLSSWEPAVRELDRRTPELTALETVFLEQLRTWRWQWSESGRARLRRQRAASAGQGTPQAGSNRWVFFMIIVALVIVRAFASALGDRAPSYNPSYTPPARPRGDTRFKLPPDPAKNDEVWKRFLEDQEWMKRNVKKHVAPPIEGPDLGPLIPTRRTLPYGPTAPQSTEPGRP